MEKYSRGSEWRKWDLHVHTPYSYLNNQFGNDFDEYVKKLFKMAIQENIASIGITDYFCIEGYKKIKREYLSNEKKLQELFTEEEIKDIKKIAIFPNIEFRLDTLVDGNRVNFHVIFSDEDELIDDIEENFLHELDFVYQGNPQEEDEKWKLKIQNLSNLGARLKKEQAEFKNDSDLFIGMKCAVINDYQITRVLKNKKSKFENKYLLFVPSDEDLSKLSWNGQDHNVRKVLIQKSDGLFASNKNTIKWGLGVFDGAENYINEFKSLKPSIWGSDAHDFESLFKPSKNNFCWIKANPTFEGLKQIIYDPKDRVLIQELKPEEKEDYQIIDKVKFIDNNFMPEEIFLNQNLTVIIGGKSTGKSVLLRNIAQTIDSEEVNKRLTEVELKGYQNKIADFRVIWKDTQENKSSEKNIINKKIIYIPQSYLNRLVDQKESKGSIEEIIKNILEQEDDIKNVFGDLENKNRETEKLITENIENIFYKKEDIVKLTAEVKNIGDKKGIVTEIEKLKFEISDLKDKSDMTEEDLKKYSELEKEIKAINNEEEDYKHDLTALEYIKKQAYFTIPSLDKLSSKELQKTLKDKFFSIKEKYDVELEKIISLDIDLIKLKQLENNKKSNDYRNSLEPLLKKITESKSLDEKIKKQHEQEEKLKTITKKEESLNELKSEYSKLISNISENSVVFFDNLFNARTKILNQKSITKNKNLDFGIEISFKNNSFGESFINNICNLRSLGQFEGGLLQNYQFSDKEKLRIDIDKIINGILNDNLVLKGSFSKKDAITKLAQNWFILDFKIKQNGDDISDMSPGKKSFVLLKLLIELDNSKCPILLDQPEDDLDNRSIYNELVQFLKLKKKERQIIIATHNPNLVVGADAECIIVANQDGEESKNKIYKFEYVQGALENTFKNKEENHVLYKQGIQEHVCDILEGGEVAFEQRKKKYNF